MDADSRPTTPPPAAPAAGWLAGFGVISLLALAGEVIVKATSLPIPGATLGMLMLLIVLLSPWGEKVSKSLSSTADTLIALLPLLLVPLAVGVLPHLDYVTGNGVAVAVALGVGWTAAFLTAALSMSLLQRLQHR
jgi:holin-like protein